MSEFPFYYSSGNSSQESKPIHTQTKGQETSAGPGDPGLARGEARWTCACCTSIKMALSARDDSFELGPLASVTYEPNK